MNEVNSFQFNSSMANHQKESNERWEEDYNRLNSVYEREVEKLKKVEKHQTSTHQREQTALDAWVDNRLNEQSSEKNVFDELITRKQDDSRKAQEAFEQKMEERRLAAEKTKKLREKEIEKRLNSIGRSNDSSQNQTSGNSTKPVTTAEINRQNPTKSASRCTKGASRVSNTSEVSTQNSNNPSEDSSYCICQ